MVSGAGGLSVITWSVSEGKVGRQCFLPPMYAPQISLLCLGLMMGLVWDHTPYALRNAVHFFLHH